MQKMMKIKLVRSACGRIPGHRKTVRGLGLRRIRQERLVVDTPQTRGMVVEVSHLVKILEQGIDAPKKARAREIQNEAQ